VRHLRPLCPRRDMRLRVDPLKKAFTTEVGICVAVLCAGATAPSVSAASPQCVKAGEHVVASNRVAVIVAHPSDRAAGPAFFGCLRRRERRYRLDLPAFGASQVIEPAGVWAAVLTRGIIRLTDLRDGTHYQSGGDGGGRSPRLRSYSRRPGPSRT
jgi:hypothetical protein